MNAAATEIVERELPVNATDQALMTAITKAEIDQAIIAAHAHPRSVKVFLDECMALATLNEGIASGCIYALPRKDGGQTKMIEGPSARLGEIVAHCWGNCRIGARVTEEGREFITAQGIFQDLEKNVHITYEVRRRITTSSGKRYGADMIGVTGNAACSIALRNAVFKGVPKAFWNPVYEAARKVVAGDSKTLANRRADALAFLQTLGATKEKVFALLDVKGVEDITLEHLAQLRGLAAAIKEGEISVEDAFTPKDETPASSSRAETAKDALRKGANTSEQPAAQGQPNNASDNIPHFDQTTAIDAIKNSTTSPMLEETWKAIRKDYADTNREMPIDVEAVYNDRDAALQQSGDQQQPAAATSKSEPATGRSGKLKL